MDSQSSPMLRNQPWSHVTVVQAGESIQSAIDAAVTAGATLGSTTTTANLVLVIYGPQVEPTWNIDARTGRPLTTAGADASGVVIMPMADVVSGINSVTAMPTELTPKPLYTAYHSAPMVALRFDDGYGDTNGLFTRRSTAGHQLTLDTAASTYLTCLEYAAYKGIPISIAIPVTSIDTAPFLTTAQLRRASQLFGAEILSHSMTHAMPSPANIAAAITEIVGSKAALEALEDSTPTNTWPDELGLVVKSFIQPGGFTGTWNIDTEAETRNYVARLIRQTYYSSMAYVGYSSPATPHLGKSASWDSTPEDSWATFAALDVPPQFSFVLAGHDIVDTGATGNQINVDTFKAAVDKIATWRDSGLITPVTVSQLFSCVRMTQTATRGGIPYGNFTGVTAGELSGSANQFGWYKSVGGAGTCVVTENAGPTGAGDTCLVVDTAIFNGATFFSPELPLRAGEQYRLRFNAKLGSATVLNRVRIRITHADATSTYLVAGHDDSNLRWQGTAGLSPALIPGNPADRATWDAAYWHYVCFSVPAWATYTRFYIEVYNDVDSDTGTVYFDNFQIDPWVLGP